MIQGRGLFSAGWPHQSFHLYPEISQTAIGPIRRSVDGYGCWSLWPRRIRYVLGDHNLVRSRGCCSCARDYAQGDGDTAVTQ